MLVLIDGPEKAGKTTVCTKLVERYKAIIRHWGPIASDVEFLAGLKRDIAILKEEPTKLIVWDRGWPADAVYSKLLNRDHRFGADPWLAEWLYGRAVSSLGGEFIFAGPSADILAAKRDETDLPVDPAEEQATYATYAQIFGLPLLSSQHSGVAEAERIADAVVAAASTRTLIQRPHRIPALTGSLRGPVFIVDDHPDGLSDPLLDGGWLVGTSPHITKIARGFGVAALSASWLDVHHADQLTQQLYRCRHVYAVGTDVYTYVRSLGVDHAALI